MYKQISANKWKSTALIILFVIFVLGLGTALGAAMGGPDGWYIGIIIAFIIAIIMTLVSYYKSDVIALSVNHARELKEGEYIRYRTAVEGLAIAAGIPTPKIYVIESRSMNAFATGRNPEHSAVAVTTALLDRLNTQELEGVVAHEISHIKNYDILLQTITIVLVGTIILISDIFLRSFWFRGSSRDSNGGGSLLIIIGIILAILSPILAQLIKLAISRKREYLADASGALLTRYPPGLASALSKLSSDTAPLETVNGGTAHLFIIEPLWPAGTEKNKKPKKRSSLFSTHPPTEERIAKLQEMSVGFQAIDSSGNLT